MNIKDKTMSSKGRARYISEIKNRNPPLITSDEILEQRLISLDRIYNDLPQYNQEILKYFPISIVALFESYFKCAFKELIDFGSPFSDNSLIILKESKGFDGDVIKSLNEHIHSLGELITVFISISNLKNILKTIGILIYGKKQGFEKEIENELIKIYNNNEQELRFEYSDLVKHIEEIFKLRHIFCHEAATLLPIELEKTLECQAFQSEILNICVF